MDFLNHREGGIIFYQVFLLSPLQCTVAWISSKNSASVHILVSVRKNFMDHSHRRLSESQNQFPEEGYWKDLQYYAVISWRQK
jgi:hypothetical protein